MLHAAVNFTRSSRRRDAKPEEGGGRAADGATGTNESESSRTFGGVSSVFGLDRRREEPATRLRPLRMDQDPFHPSHSGLFAVQMNDIHVVAVRPTGRESRAIWS